jgi:hypothetical protein
MRRVLVGTAVAFLALTGLLGFAHTKAGAPLLAVMGRHAKGQVCPLGYGAGSGAGPAEKARARRSFAAAHRGAAAARARPALGFTLERTTRGEVLAWAERHGLRCRVPRPPFDLECSDVPAGALPGGGAGEPIRTLWLGFGSREELLSVVAVRWTPEAAAIRAAFTSAVDALTQHAGPASASTGAASVELLAAGPLRQASAEYRFSDYYSVARATHLGDGYVLTEEYRALGD